MKQFTIKILSLSIVVAVATFIIFRFAIPQFYLPIFPVILLYIIGTSLLIHALLTRAGTKNIRQFSTFFMGSIGLKLFLYIIFIMIYLMLNKQDALNFVIQFMILYIVYTVFETGALLRDLKEQNKE